jgi:uridine kinase
MATVICLDDYHSLDRKGRATAGVTALAPEAQNFDLMAEQVGIHNIPEIYKLLIIIWKGGCYKARR